MEINERLTLSYYKDIAELNKEHNVSLVQHIETNKIYIKKSLTLFDEEVYHLLKNQPIPGVPRIQEIVRKQEELILIEEYISGDSLQEKLDQGNVSDQEIGCWLISISHILHQLHSFQKPIVHRDIKPSNIMIDNGGKCFLLDFNAAKFVNTQQDRDTVLLGTQGYAAPEQYGFGSSTTLTDIYGFGKLVESLVQGRTSLEKKYAPLIAKCTQLNPNDRLQSFEEVLIFLEQDKGAKNRSSVSESFLLPGFRSGSVAHGIIAIFGYLMIIFIAADLKADTAKMTMQQLNFERFCFGCALFSMVLFFANYRGVRIKLPLCNSDNAIIKVIGTAFWSTIIFSLWVLISQVKLIFG